MTNALAYYDIELNTVVNDFIVNVPGACIIKHYKIRNLQKNDKFGSKLASFRLDKLTGVDMHTSLNMHTCLNKQTC